MVEAEMRMVSICVTLYWSGEESDGGELAVSLRVEAGDLDHVLRGRSQLLQAGPAVPLACGQLGGGHSNLTPVRRVYCLQLERKVTIFLSDITNIFLLNLLKPL